MTTMNPPATSEALALAACHLYPTYARPDIVLDHGEGWRVWDTDGREYVDLIAGIAVNALGYAHPRVTKAIADQAGRLVHASNLFHHPWQGLLAKKLAELSGLPRVFLTNSGTEAVEAAIKMSRVRAKARKEPGRTRLVALEGSFHGRSCGALSITSEEKYRLPFEPLLGGVTFVPPDDVASLRSAVTPLTGALFIEPVQGEGGVRPISERFLKAARESCDESGALLVFDEIQCGLGRTGSWFAFQESGVMPDLVTIAKPIAGGLPLGALLGREETAEFFTVGKHGTTFGGGPLVCRVALECLAIIEEEGLLESTEQLGGMFREALRDLAGREPSIVEVRGKGLMTGVALDRDTAPIVAALRNRGWLIGSARGNTLRLVPPLIIEADALSRFVGVLGEVLAETRRPSSETKGEKR